MVNDKKTVYLHIGLHKTGTTSIQRALRVLGRELSASGVQYPQTGIPKEEPVAEPPGSADSFGGHHLLAWSLVDKGRVSSMLLDQYGAQVKADLWSRLRSELQADRAAKAVLSSEDFEWLDGDGVARILDYLRDFRVVPVIYFRNPIDYMVSMYKELVKTGLYAGSFGRFADDYRGLCLYRDRVLVWKRNGVAEIEIRSFDKVANRGGPVVDFLELIGAGEIALGYVEGCRANVSPPAGAVRIMAQTNKILMRSLPERYVRRINRIIERLVVVSRRPGSRFPYGVASARDLDRLRDSLRQEIDEFCNEYVAAEDWRYFKV